MRLRCPADSPLCVPQETPPDDGCGASLAWWFGGDAETKRAKKKEADATESAFVLPEACAALAAEPAALADASPADVKSSRTAALRAGAANSSSCRS